ncbi:Uncharacterised protein [Moellerella wisconsensis]|nr:Uncharacterised protein [Moellerella wisconsensis]
MMPFLYVVKLRTYLINSWSIIGEIGSETAKNSSFFIR